MRQFFAIPLPSELRNRIGKISDPYRDIKGLKIVKPDNLHLTLVFIGDIDIKDRLERIRKLQFSPFDLYTKSVRLFPERKPRLIWMEVSQPDELSVLRKNLADIFGIDEKFRAHITIARIKWLSPENKKLLMEMTTRNNTCNFSFRVDHFNLYNSELNSDGPSYRVIESFPALSGNRD
jgi:RNA 2',3'-cyclic 3'-phosphodiesterase